MSHLSINESVRARGLVWLGLLLILIFNFCIRWHLREMPL